MDVVLFSPPRPHYLKWSPWASVKTRTLQGAHNCKTSHNNNNKNDAKFANTSTSRTRPCVQSGRRSVGDNPPPRTVKLPFPRNICSSRSPLVGKRPQQDGKARLFAVCLWYLGTKSDLGTTCAWGVCCWGSKCATPKREHAQVYSLSPCLCCVFYVLERVRRVVLIKQRSASSSFVLGLTYLNSPNIRPHSSAVRRGVHQQRDRFRSYLPGDVIHHDDPVRTPVVGRCYRPEAFLPCGIPLDRPTAGRNMAQQEADTKQNTRDDQKQATRGVYEKQFGLHMVVAKWRSLREPGRSRPSRVVVSTAALVGTI